MKRSWIYFVMMFRFAGAAGVSGQVPLPEMKSTWRELVASKVTFIEIRKCSHVLIKTNRLKYLIYHMSNEEKM